MTLENLANYVCLNDKYFLNIPQGERMKGSLSLIERLYMFPIREFIFFVQRIQRIDRWWNFEFLILSCFLRMYVPDSTFVNTLVDHFFLDDLFTFLLARSRHVKTVSVRTRLIPGKFRLKEDIYYLEKDDLSWGFIAFLLKNNCINTIKLLKNQEKEILAANLGSICGNHYSFRCLVEFMTNYKEEDFNQTFQGQLDIKSHILFLISSPESTQQYQELFGTELMEAELVLNALRNILSFENSKFFKASLKRKFYFRQLFRQSISYPSFLDHLIYFSPGCSYSAIVYFLINLHLPALQLTICIVLKQLICKNDTFRSECLESFTLILSLSSCTGDRMLIKYLLRNSPYSYKTLRNYIYQESKKAAGHLIEYNFKDSDSIRIFNFYCPITASICSAHFGDAIFLMKYFRLSFDQLYGERILYGCYKDFFRRINKNDVNEKFLLSQNHNFIKKILQ